MGISGQELDYPIAIDKSLTIAVISPFRHDAADSEKWAVVSASSMILPITEPAYLGESRKTYSLSIQDRQLLPETGSRCGPITKPLFDLSAAERPFFGGTINPALYLLDDIYMVWVQLCYYRSRDTTGESCPLPRRGFSVNRRRAMAEKVWRFAQISAVAAELHP